MSIDASTPYEFSKTVVTRYRRHSAALRKIRRELDSGRVRGNRATERAALRHLTGVVELAEHLVATKRRHLAGLLTEEADLHSRIYESKQAGVTYRPELELRLKLIRRDIRMTATR